MDIYIAINKQQTGPFSEEEVQRKLADGDVVPSDLAWHEGLAGWVPLSQVVDTCTSPPPASQPPPIHTSPPQAAPPPTTMSGGKLVMPRTPPRSVGWMTFSGFMWPGLGQLLCGQNNKGAILMVASFFACGILSATCIGAPIALGICIASAIDANKVATKLASGRPVGEWEYFPDSSK